MKLFILLITQVLSEQCNLSEMQLLENLDDTSIQACLVSTSSSELATCLASNSVTVSSGCLTCFFGIVTDVQECTLICQADALSQTCVDCMLALQSAGIQCAPKSGLMTATIASWFVVAIAMIL